jgi:hypothetical protein
MDGGSSSRRRSRWIIVAAAVLGVAIALVVLVAPDPGEQAVAGRATTTTVPPRVPTSAPTTTVTTTAPTTSTVVPIPASPGRLLVATPVLDFGTSGVVRQLQLRNTGEQPVIWSAVETVEWLAVARRSGGITGARDLLVAVTLDRSRAPEGAFSTVIAVTGPGGVVPVPVTGSADRGPVISGEGTDAVLLYARAGPCVPETTAVSATVTDGVGVASVVLAWRTPDNEDAVVEMVAAGGGVWQGELGPFHESSDITWWVVTTDTGGNGTRSSDHVLPVVPCAR